MQAFEQGICRTLSRKSEWCLQWCNCCSTWFYEYHMCEIHRNEAELRLHCCAHHSNFFYHVPPFEMFPGTKMFRTKPYAYLKVYLEGKTLCVSRVWILQQITSFQLTPLTFIANFASCTRCICLNALLDMAATCSANRSHESRATLRLHTKYQ